MISLLQLDWPQLIMVLFIMLFAGLVHGTLGLGFPMVATPMLAVIFDVRTAILITLLPTIAVNLASIWNSRDSLENIRRFLPLTWFVFVGSLLGAYILVKVDPGPFRLALAGLILLYLWTNLTGRVPHRLLGNHVLAAMVVLGLLAGFAGATTNVMVAILIIFFLALEVQRKTMVPVLNICFLIGKSTQIAVLSLAGFVSLGLIYETIPLALVSVSSLLVGQRLREKIALEVYTRILQLLLALLAIVLILQFFI